MLAHPPLTSVPTTSLRNSTPSPLARNLVSVSVIIPAINESRTIGSAVSTAFEAGAFEVIVVDGGSSDSTREVALQNGANVLSSPPGRAIQQNVGAQVAVGEILLFLHADALLPHSAFQQMDAALKKTPNLLGGGFQQVISAPGLLFRLLERGNGLRAKYQKLIYGDQALFIRRSEFTAMGGFKEIPIMEDFELSSRMSRRGKLELLEGPIHVNPRRWRRYGVIRQTLLNWILTGLFRVGFSPFRLASWYRRHDQQKAKLANSQIEI